LEHNQKLRDLEKNAMQKVKEVAKQEVEVIAKRKEEDIAKQRKAEDAAKQKASEIAKQKRRAKHNKKQKEYSRREEAKDAATQKDVKEIAMQDRSKQKEVEDAAKQKVEEIAKQKVEQTTLRNEVEIAKLAIHGAEEEADEDDLGDMTPASPTDGSKPRPWVADGMQQSVKKALEVAEDEEEAKKEDREAAKTEFNTAVEFALQTLEKMQNCSERFPDSQLQQVVASSTRIVRSASSWLQLGLSGQEFGRRKLELEKIMQTVSQEFGDRLKEVLENSASG